VLLKEQIREKRKEISIKEKEAFLLHLQLSNIIHPLLWAEIDKLTHWRAESDNIFKKNKLKTSLAKRCKNLSSNKRIETRNSKILHDYIRENLKCNIYIC